MKKKLSMPELMEAGRQKAAELADRVETVPATEAKAFTFTTRKRNESAWNDVFEKIEDLHKGEALKIPGVKSLPAGLKNAAKRAGAVLEFAGNGEGLLVRLREYIASKE